tara:strand:- start:1033 stop:1494 length:462 start_codon:yes stop_codon:yes gene_type:complete
MQSSALFSECRTYRYALWRIWDESLDSVLFIGLNPSKADESYNDPTIRRCINFTKKWGYGGLCMANLFAYRATEPKTMMIADDPIGPVNDQILFDLVSKAKIVVAAWGNHGSFMGRSVQISRSILNLRCLRINKSGEPAHPLYLNESTRLITY